MLAPTLWPKLERLDKVGAAQVHRITRYLYEGAFGDSIAPYYHVPVDLPASSKVQNDMHRVCLVCLSSSVCLDESKSCYIMFPQGCMQVLFARQYAHNQAVS